MTITLGKTAETITALLEGVRRLISANRFGDVSKRTWKVRALPGRSDPILLVAAPRAKTVHERPIRHNILSLTANILDLRAWRDMDPLACFMLAGYTAVILQPLIYGSLGGSLVALM